MASSEAESRAISESEADSIAASEAEEELPEQSDTYTWSDRYMSVVVELDQPIDASAKLKVSYLRGSQARHVQARAAQDTDEGIREMAGYEAYELTWTVDGREIEVTGGMTVTFSYYEPLYLGLQDYKWPQAYVYKIDGDAYYLGEAQLDRDHCVQAFRVSGTSLRCLVVAGVQDHINDGEEINYRTLEDFLEFLEDYAVITNELTEWDEWPWEEDCPEDSLCANLPDEELWGSAQTCIDYVEDSLDYLEYVSEVLANGQSTGDVEAINLYADAYGAIDETPLEAVTDPETGLIDPENRILVINIIAAYADQDLVWEPHEASWLLDYETVVPDPEAEWDEYEFNRRSILYNLQAQTEVPGETVPYTGELTLTEDAAGTYLAPEATIRLEGDLVGQIAADQLQMNPDALLMVGGITTIGEMNWHLEADGLLEADEMLEEDRLAQEASESETEDLGWLLEDEDLSETVVPGADELLEVTEPKDETATEPAESVTEGVESTTESADEPEKPGLSFLGGLRKLMGLFAGPSADEADDASNEAIANDALTDADSNDSNESNASNESDESGDSNASNASGQPESETETEKVTEKATEKESESESASESEKKGTGTEATVTIGAVAVDDADDTVSLAGVVWHVLDADGEELKDALGHAVSVSLTSRAGAGAASREMKAGSYQELAELMASSVKAGQSVTWMLQAVEVPEGYLLAGDADTAITLTKTKDETIRVRYTRDGTMSDDMPVYRYIRYTLDLEAAAVEYENESHYLAGAAYYLLDDNGQPVTGTHLARTKDSSGKTVTGEVTEAITLTSTDDGAVDLRLLGSGIPTSGTWILSDEAAADIARTADGETVTWTLRELTYPSGYMLHGSSDRTLTFTKATDGALQLIYQNENGNTVRSQDMAASLVYQHEARSDEDSSDLIRVYKRCYYDGKRIVPTDTTLTFYVAVFDANDPASRVSSVMPVKFKSGTTMAYTTFTRLEAGSYLIRETDEWGNPVDEGTSASASGTGSSRSTSGTSSSGTGSKTSGTAEETAFTVTYATSPETSKTAADNEVKITNTDAQVYRVVVSNHYEKLPSDFSGYETFYVTKVVRDSSGQAVTNSTDDFYFTIYIYNRSKKKWARYRVKDSETGKYKSYVGRITAATDEKTGVSTYQKKALAFLLNEETSYRDIMVVETDSAGRLMKSGDQYLIGIDNQKIRLRLGQDESPVVTITNTQLPKETEAPQESETETESEETQLTATLTLTKKVTYLDSPVRVNSTYYIGLFADEELTQLRYKKALTLRNATEASGELTVKLYKLASKEITFYVAEVNSEGKVVVSSTTRGYEISQNQTQITLNADNLTDEAIVTNNIASGGAAEKALTVTGSRLAGDSTAVAESLAISRGTSGSGSSSSGSGSTSAGAGAGGVGGGAIGRMHALETLW